MTGTRITSSLAIAALAALLARPATAWHDEGHVYAARAAVEALPDDVPAFFRQGADTVAHSSLDPDVIRTRSLPQIRDREAPEHYLDYEALDGRPLPATRYEFIRLCQRHDLDPAKVGLLPYTITEWTQQLAMAFAEHRRWPDNPHIRAKCLVYAGILSHYTADLHMPLHTTVHFDGRASHGDDGYESPHSGIHAKVDALPTKLPYNQIFAEPLPEPAAAGDVFGFVMDQFHRSHRLVDRVYELEDRLPQVPELTLEDPELIAFTLDRTRAAARFTAEMFLTAWRMSADLETPFWLDRDVFDEAFDPDVIPEQPARP